MFTLAKSAILSLSLLAAAAVAAQAQSSIASLPPDAAATSSVAVAPSPNAYPGPNPGKGWYHSEEQTRPVAPSQRYVGPSPSEAYYGVAPHFQKPPGYDSDAAMHPYVKGASPAPN
jgi:hypothetical protein